MTLSAPSTSVRAAGLPLQQVLPVLVKVQHTIMTSQDPFYNNSTLGLTPSQSSLVWLDGSNPLALGLTSAQQMAISNLTYLYWSSDQRSVVPTIGFVSGNGSRASYEVKVLDSALVGVQIRAMGSTVMASSNLSLAYSIAVSRSVGLSVYRAVCVSLCLSVSGDA